MQSFEDLWCRYKCLIVCALKSTVKLIRTLGVASLPAIFLYRSCQALELGQGTGPRSPGASIFIVKGFDVV